ncbi:Zinc finger MYM-type protein 1 [Anabarilius grahami]|uniref:Zinc finger MYM-type protein 1 n=1 Tax=Anabarilius grahami TaxID=495550 RepID=A0A3N0YRN8_ANAGA|nr:Zinc finger MYM-type protein 1 [Anabarilius grahami]
MKGYRDWKHGAEKDKGFHKHASSKEHLTCLARWKEHQMRIDSGKEISTLLNSDQLGRNRYYLSALFDVVGFLAENQLPFRGSCDAFDDMAEDGSGLFLSLLNYTVKKDPTLSEIIKHIPRNARYTSPDLQNELISIMSNVVTDAIVQEILLEAYCFGAVQRRATKGGQDIYQVSAIIKYYKEIISLLSEIDTERTYGDEVRMEAIGLLREISQPAFMIIAHFVKKVLMLLDGPNKLLQSEDMDLLTGLELVVSAIECLSKLRCEAKFTELWDAVTDLDVTSAPSKWQLTVNKNLHQ